jgi:hypothetical protein
MRISEVAPAPIEVFDVDAENGTPVWRQLEQGCQLLPTSSTLLLRATIDSTFPTEHVLDMATGLHAARRELEQSPSVELPGLFHRCFPRLDLPDLDVFLAAVWQWAEIPHERQRLYISAGRTYAGSWTQLIIDSQ